MAADLRFRGSRRPYSQDGTALEILPEPGPGIGPAVPQVATALHWPHHRSGFADARRLVLFQSSRLIIV